MVPLQPDAGTINYYFCLVAIAIIPFAVLAFFWPCIHRRYNTNFSVRVSDSAALTFEPKTLMFQTKGEPRGCLPCDSKGIELKAVFEPSHAGKTVQIKDGKVSFEEKQYRVNWRTPAPANEKMGMPVSLKIKNVPPLKQDRAPQTLIVIEHDFGKVVLERETVEDGERGEYESWSFDNPIKDVPKTKKERNKCKTCNGTGMDENAKSSTQMDNILSYVYSHLKDPGIDVESGAKRPKKDIFRLQTMSLLQANNISKPLNMADANLSKA